MPVVVEDREVRVAEAAVFDFDFDFVVGEGAEVDFLADEFLFGGGGNVGGNHGRVEGLGWRVEGGRRRSAGGYLSVRGSGLASRSWWDGVEGRLRILDCGLRIDEWFGVGR